MERRAHVHHHHADAFLVVEGELTLAVGNGSLRGAGGEPSSSSRPTSCTASTTTAPESARFFNLHMPASGFGDYMRGRKPDFDQHEPPADGGADPASVVAVRLSG